MLVCLVPVDRTMSRTTVWRLERKRRQEAAIADGLEQPPPVQRKHKRHKVHECRQCHQPLSCKCKSDTLTLLYINSMLLAETNHSNYYGSWHCPNVPNAVPLEEWKAAKKAELAAKRAARQQQQQQ